MYPEWCYNWEFEDRIGKVISTKQAAHVSSTTRPGSRSSDSSDEVTPFNYFETDSEHSATLNDLNSDDEEAYDDDNDQVDVFTSLVVNDLEDILFADTDLHALKEKENTLREKKVIKYYRYNEIDSKLSE